MCLITFAYKIHPIYNLIVVANRDEFFDRETRPAHQWENPPGIYGGQDLRQGGTWLGINTEGKFTAVTNYRDGTKLQEGKKSRGLLARDYLSTGKPAPDYLSELQSRANQFGGFNLLCGDVCGLFYLSNAGGEYSKLQAGLYGLSNAYLDVDWPKVKKAKSNLQMLLNHRHMEPRELMQIMHDPQTASDEELPDTGISYEWEKQLSSQFIRVDGYGTRCTTVILQEYSGKTVFFEQEFSQEGAGSSSTREFDLNCVGEHE